MRKLLLIITVLFFGLALHTNAQDRQVSGKVVSAEDNSPLPGVSIAVKGTSRGTTTGADGSFKISVGSGASLTFSFVGFDSKTISVGNQTVINVALGSNASQLQEVVVTALGERRSEKALSYSVQSVKEEQLNTIRQTNLNNALAGKIAGIQVRSQSSVALGRDASIRIRGAGSLSDKAPLYILDGTPVGSSDINLDDVESVSVLKGPSATALYGQRGDAGVILMTSKKGVVKKGIGLEVNQSVYVDNVYILPSYQNSYAGGSSADLIKFNYQDGMPTAWKALDGKYYHDYSDDASWGPRMVGQEYIPWYSWYPGTQYSGKTEKLTPQPNNIRDFFESQVATNTNLNFSKAGENFSTRISLTGTNQNGMLYNSKGTKYTIASQTTIDLSKNLTVGINFNYVDYTINGQFDDAYSNQSTGSFNSWFHRNVDMGKVKELKDLRSPEGILASWNHNNPSSYDASNPVAFYGANYWYNFHSYFDNVKYTENRKRLFGDINLTYKFNDHLKVAGFARINRGATTFESAIPSILQTSATQTGLKASYALVEYQGNFVNNRWTPNENNYELIATYNNKFNDTYSVDLIAGGNIRQDTYRVLSSNTVDGLIVPDYFALSNSVSTPVVSSFRSKKEVRSIYARASLGYKDMIFLEGSLRNDNSSALPAGANSYTYPSIGGSFVASELLKDKIPALSFAKVRGSWAQVGSDLDPYLLSLNYTLGTDKFNGNAVMGTPNAIVDANIKPALSSSYEFGIDLKFFKNRYGLAVTYYNEDKINEILNVPVSGASGFTSKLINAGQLTRNGLEISIDATPVKTKDVTWTSTLNFAKNTSKIVSLADGVETVTARDASGSLANGAFSASSGASTIHQIGLGWGQIRGGGFTYKDGVKVVDESGLYVQNPAQYLGSVLPDFTGGWVNQVTYKDFTLSANVEFSKGGKYFSLSDSWGTYSGLLEKTAGMNDKGNPIRDAVADGGGVHVVGVTKEGKAVDTYVDAQTYYHQFRNRNIAEEFVHDLDFIKLREVSIGYKIPLKGKKVLQTATVSFVARNPWLIYAKNRNYDPSELSTIYGENGQFPGTRSFGVNVRLGF
ncbi:TonB-linked SusC/RagA family outer membrane protein [Arcicella aurantiaca]|uniref:TonB-linked SusC/RagA family outer membrane protein n=1 Tax=Arcicella aurantiaca TaxID=591202 RepID=A0A316EFH4_9BACT|nr:SusC/RagA family TonB-linked outer membrane protein [Arcicella aurantiaca]PWK28159.1 TonB-linked SusC/RagA family outer membrane protein [Arcicella aurantiaca]